ncbi:MAG: hypothetical protein HY748_08100 [Elusimicrobia bacterium]|nr:hypothetical protein [Elusimicrobiota bacterium]
MTTRDTLKVHSATPSPTAGSIMEVRVKALNPEAKAWPGGFYGVRALIMDADGRLVRDADMALGAHDLLPGRRTDFVLEVEIPRWMRGDCTIRMQLFSKSRTIASSDIPLRLGTATQALARPAPEPEQPEPKQKEPARPGSWPRWKWDAELLDWALRRYDRKTILSFDWEGVDEAELQARLRQREEVRIAVSPRAEPNLYVSAFGTISLAASDERNRWTNDRDTWLGGRLGFWGRYFGMAFDYSSYAFQQTDTQAAPEEPSARSSIGDVYCFSLLGRLPVGHFRPYAGSGIAVVRSERRREDQYSFTVGGWPFPLTTITYRWTSKTENVDPYFVFPAGLAVRVPGFPAEVFGEHRFLWNLAEGSDRDIEDQWFFGLSLLW